ncbi:hypothetical protein ABFX02_02G045000 [Erythranthe guttata]
MDQGFTGNESLIVRVQQLEQERNELYKDIEQLCMQQAGPAYLGIATRMHFQRTAGLEQEIEELKTKLGNCTRENKNLEEELSEAYRIKSQLADLHSAEVLKNIEAEKQLKFFQGCVAAAFAERDNAIMEAEKAKENEELLPQELNKSQRRVEELTAALVEEKRLVTTLQTDLENHERQNKIFKQVIDKFYHIRQSSLDIFTDASWEEKCECILDDSDEMWRFQNDDDTSTSDYINSLEAEIDTLRKSANNLQNKLRMGMEIENHLKKKVSNLKKKKIFSEDKIKKQISALLNDHSQYKIDITNLLDEGYSELKSITDSVIEKINEFEMSEKECNSKSSSVQEKESNENECRDVHINADSGPASITKINDPVFLTSSASECGETSEALAMALHEKVETLLLLSQQDERHLLERNVSAALQKKIEELQRNLLQVTNEKVKALMELAQLKQELYTLQEKMNEGKHLGETVERRTVQEKDGRLKNLLKKSYLTRWVGGSDDYEKPSHHMDFARMKIENATLKESLESMEHLLSSVRRLRISLLEVKELGEGKSENSMESLERIIVEANLVKTALGSSLPISWCGETDGSYDEKMDFVSGAGFEMVELLIFAAHLLKDRIS